MGTVIELQPHMDASGFKKASIGTAPPVSSLNRIASFNDTPLRPAKMLRKCASEQGMASASCPTDISLASAQRSKGCGSDMGTTISTRNGKSQPEIFLSEIESPIGELLQSGMPKRSDSTPPKIYLGDWLEEFEMDNGAAAKIAECDQSYISNIVANRKPNINVLYLFRLSESMGVTVNDFYRPLPNKSHLAALKNLSPKAQATLLARFQKKA